MQTVPLAYIPKGQDATQLAPFLYKPPEQVKHVVESEHEVQEASKVVQAIRKLE